MQNLQQQRRTGRPPKTSAEQILSAAALFEPNELQLTALAEELGISVKTVYYYFPNRAALLEALTERSVAQFGLPDLSAATTARAALEAVARWAFRLGEAQPVWLLTTAAPIGVGVRAMKDFFERMDELGVDEASATRAYVIVTNYASAAGESAHRTRLMGGTSKGNVTRLVADYGDEATIRRVERVLTGADAEEWFEDGLRVVLAGIESELLSS